MARKSGESNERTGVVVSQNGFLLGLISLLLLFLVCTSGRGCGHG